MKSIVIIFSVLLNISGVIAQDLIVKSDFNHNWSYTPLMTRTDKNSVLSVKMFKRYLWIDQKPIQIAETNFTYLKNPQGNVNLKSLSETIKKSFPLNSLNSHKIPNGIEIDGEWKKINRFIKMDLIENRNEFIIITSFVRSGLKKSVLPEISELHSLLKNYKESDKETKTTFFQMIMSEAYAQGISGNELKTLLGNSNLNTSAVTNLLSGGSPTLLTTESKVTVDGTVNTNLIVGADKESNANWSKTNNTLNELNGNFKGVSTTAGEMNTTINKQGADANKNWAKTNDVINTNWAESNKIAAQMMDANHMAKVAYYTAAGAALGAITMNLAVEGVTTGISYLFELFTGTKKKKLEWEDFQKAISSWDDQLSGLVKMEQVVDEFIGAFDFFSDKNLDNDYLKNLKLTMRDMRFDRDLMLEKFKNTELPNGCRRVFYNAADELDQKLQDYDKILKFAGKNNITTNQNENYFCQQLKELQRKLLGAETQIQDLRLSILKAENQFYDKNTDTKEQREKTIDQINDGVANTIKRRVAFNQAASETLKDSFEKEKTEWVNQCVDAGNSEGKKIKAEINNRFTHFFKAKALCQTAFDSSHSPENRNEIGQKVFEAENKLREDLKLKNNDDIDVKLSEEQMNWLTRIHMDAFCYQYAHGEKGKVPEKCSQFPEMLYSMKLSKGFDKAKAAYGERCEEMYLKGVKKLGGE